MQASASSRLQGRPRTLLLLAGPVAARKRHLHHPHLPLPRGEYIISKLHLFLYFTYLWDFHVANSTCILIHLSPFPFFFFLSSLSTRRTLLPLAPYCLMSPSLRYILFPCMHLRCHVFLCALFSLLHVYLFLPFLLIPALFLPFLLLLFLFLKFFFFFKRLILSSFLFITHE